MNSSRKSAISHQRHISHLLKSSCRLKRIFNRWIFSSRSVSTIVLLTACLSTLSGLFVGFHRKYGRVHHRVDYLSNKKRTIVKKSSAAGIISSSTSASTNIGIASKQSARFTNTNNNNDRDSNHIPTILSLRDLTLFQRHPQASLHRYIVSPPQDNEPITLVRCQTTAGSINIIVHPSWAPLGAYRFLQMVTSHYFSTRVALMRCIPNFICQFGIAGDPLYNTQYVGRGNLLKDDPNWLPEGPSHRTNELGVKRFAKGYLAYAGGGINSRTNQFIIALSDNERLGGGSPWEVPWGEVVDEESFATLDKIYTGYGENGPSQGRLSKEGSSEIIAKEFPMLDYILGCDAVDSE